MNDLSLFFYLAEVIPRLGGVSFALLLLTSGLIVSVLTAYMESQTDANRGEEKSPYKIFSCLGFLWLLFLTAFVLTPSKETIYFIAASEAGEMVVNTPQAQELMSDLKEILDIQLNKLKQ